MGVQPKNNIYSQKIWLKRYPRDIPTVIDADHYSSLLDMFEQSVEKFADKVAYLSMGHKMTFLDLEQRSRAFATYLQQQFKVKTGDRIALMLPNVLQYPVALFGALRAGVTVVNVNPLYTPRELKQQLADSGATIIVVLANFAHNLQLIIHQTQIEHTIVTHLGDEFSFFKRHLINFSIKFIKKLVPPFKLPKACLYRQVLAEGHQADYAKPHIDNHQVAFLQYTGGTTGIAKGAMLTHRNIQANLAQIKAAYQPVIRPGNEMALAALPFYHIFALTINCFLFIEQGGCNLLITNPRDISGLVKVIARYPCSVVVGVNTLFNSLLHNEKFRKLDFSALRLTVGGGMSIQRIVAEEWKKVTGKHLLEGYGLTECSPLVSGCPYDLKEYNGSIGLPVPSTIVRLVDNKNQDVALGEIGELLIKGPQVMLGYWQSKELTNDAIKDGWLATGDLGKMDKEGFIYLVDRKKDMILVSGFNVYPNEIEDVVSAHPKVLEVAAIAVPSEISGEAVKLCVVKKESSLTEKELLIYCKKNLTGYKRPKIIEFYDELPKSNVGKILRKVLRDEAKQ